MTYSTRVYIVERHSLTVVNSGMLEVSQALKESSEAALLQPPYPPPLINHAFITRPIADATALVYPAGVDRKRPFI